MSRRAVTVDGLMRNAVWLSAAWHQGGGKGLQGFRVSEARVNVLVVVIRGIDTDVGWNEGLRRRAG